MLVTSNEAIAKNFEIFTMVIKLTKSTLSILAAMKRHFYRLNLSVAGALHFVQIKATRTDAKAQTLGHT